MVVVGKPFSAQLLATASATQGKEAPNRQKAESALVDAPSMVLFRRRRPIHAIVHCPVSIAIGSCVCQCYYFRPLHRGQNPREI